MPLLLMMDTLSSGIMQKICDLTAIGKYVIVSADEFFETFPDGEAESAQTLKRVLRALQTDGFIDLKYSGDDMFCVAPLKEPPEELPTTPQKARYKMSDGIKYFLCAFAGGAAGSFIATLIAGLVNHA